MAVQSPCDNVCKFDSKTGFCTSCLRTLAEARAWSKMTDHRRHQIINERKRRAGKFTPNPPTS
jgi:hypothetical protein